MFPCPCGGRRCRSSCPVDVGVCGVDVDAVRAEVDVGACGADVAPNDVEFAVFFHEAVADVYVLMRSVES